MTQAKGDKVRIVATGNQAPYGIGATIAIIPLAHRRKIQAELDRWYNPPAVELIRPRKGSYYFHWRDFKRDGELYPIE